VLRLLRGKKKQYADQQSVESERADRRKAVFARVWLNLIGEKG